MPKDNFDSIEFARRQPLPMFFAAIGNDDIGTGLYIGSKDAQGGNSGNVGDLQRSLNKLGASPALVDDGKFGQKTKNAVTQLNYPYPVTSTVFYKILSDVQGGGGFASTIPPTSTITEAELQALYRKYVAAKGKLTYANWIAREQRRTKWKNIGSGVFQVGTDWLKQKYSGTNTGDNIPLNQYPVDTNVDNRILGLPPTVVYVSGAVLAGLLIWGVAALAIRAGKAKPPVAPTQSFASGRP